MLCAALVSEAALFGEDSVVVAKDEVKKVIYEQAVYKLQTKFELEEACAQAKIVQNYHEAKQRRLLLQMEAEPPLRQSKWRSFGGAPSSGVHRSDVPGHGATPDAGQPCCGLRGCDSKQHEQDAKAIEELYKDLQQYFERGTRILAREGQGGGRGTIDKATNEHTYRGRHSERRCWCTGPWAQGWQR
mmetsp:Transcript_18420/g.58143  ORF Transcript_18420/g.58143 Transcript_18420/m.58143 type:complete len:187 (-) Transcript_18420:1133-1693(-)